MSKPAKKFQKGPKSTTKKCLKVPKTAGRGRSCKKNNTNPRPRPLEFISPKGTLSKIAIEIKTIYGQKACPLGSISTGAQVSGINNKLLSGTLKRKTKNENGNFRFFHQT